MRTDIYDATIREQLQAGKTNAAAGTTPNQAAPIKTITSENSTLTTLKTQQDEQELEMVSAAAREKQLRNQTAAVFGGNPELASKINEPQRDSAADSPWCNCENCQTA